MSGSSQFIDVASLQPLSTSVRVLGQGIIEANTSGDQAMLTLSGTTYMIAIIIEKISGGALTLAVLKIGYNAGANDVVSSQALVGLGTAGAAVEITPVLGHPIGVAAGVLKANMSTLSGVAASLRWTAIGVGG